MTSKNPRQLDLCGEETVDVADKETLTRLIFEYGVREDFFAVLELPTGHFMQTTSTGEPGKFVLEVREGSSDDHRRCSDRSLHLGTVVEAMTSFFDGDDRWRTSLQWEPCDPQLEMRQYKRAHALRLSLYVLVLVFLVFVLYWKSS